MAEGFDTGVLRERDTWKAFGIGIVLFCIIHLCIAVHIRAVFVHLRSL